MSKSSEDNFLQPVISTFGLGISLISALTPFLSSSYLKGFFLQDKLALPSSTLAFLFGLVLVWLILENVQIINFYVIQFRINVTITHITLAMIVIGILLAFVFLWFGSFDVNDSVLAIIQALIYVLFFQDLIGIFALLFNNSRYKYQYKELQENFNNTLLETLRSNGILASNIQIQQDQHLDPTTASKLGISSIFGIAFHRVVKILITKQEEKVIQVVVTNDGKKVIKNINEHLQF